MTKKVMVFLSKREADAMYTALGNSTSCEDVMSSIFADKTDIRACLRAEKKLRIAICGYEEAKETRALNAKRFVERVKNNAKLEG